jgi:hypothetical protein
MLSESAHGLVYLGEATVVADVVGDQVRLPHGPTIGDTEAGLHERLVSRARDARAAVAHGFAVSAVFSERLTVKHAPHERFRVDEYRVADPGEESVVVLRMERGRYVETRDSTAG